MKKSFLMGAIALSIFMISCNEDNDNRLENNIPQTELTQKNATLAKLPRAEQERIAKDFFNNLTDKNIAGKPRGFCQPFTVHVNIGIFEVETEILMCCTTLTMNCVPVPKVLVHKNANDPAIKVFEITDSSIYVNEEGQKIRIKKGIYEVSADDTVQFELEEVK